MPVDLRPPTRRAARTERGPRPVGRRRRLRRWDAFGAWRRRTIARLPTGPILLVLTGTVAVASLRAGPGDLGPGAGAVAPVVVARTDLAPGAIVASDDLEVRPLALGGDRAGVATDPASVVGRQVTAPILRGEPIVEGRLAPGGLVGVAAATPPGRSSFAVPTDPRLPPVVVGQQVDLYAVHPVEGTLAHGATADAGRGWPPTSTSASPSSSSSSSSPPSSSSSWPAAGGDGGPIAHGALVVAVDEQRITVAVEPGEAPTVARALIGSTVILAVTGPAPDP